MLEGGMVDEAKDLIMCSLVGAGWWWSISSSTASVENCTPFVQSTELSSLSPEIRYAWRRDGTDSNMSTTRARCHVGDAPFPAPQSVGGSRETETCAPSRRKRRPNRWCLSRTACASNGFLKNGARTLATVSTTPRCRQLRRPSPLARHHRNHT